jgi:hypothetical protein
MFSLENNFEKKQVMLVSDFNRMDNDQNSPMLTKKILYASFKKAKTSLHVIQLRWRDKVSKDLIITNLKNRKQQV